MRENYRGWDTLFLPSAGGKFIPFNRKPTKVFQHEVSSPMAVCVLKQSGSACCYVLVRTYSIAACSAGYKSLHKSTVAALW